MSITEQDIINEVLRLAAENPDFVYQAPDYHPEETRGTCVYIHDGNGSCIVGQALVNKGIDPEEIERFEGLPADLMLSNLGIKEEADQGQTWLDQVQSYQDTGTPWGEAVEEADAE